VPLPAISGSNARPLDGCPDQAQNHRLLAETLGKKFGLVPPGERRGNVPLRGNPGQAARLR
jgi:hypothetical protein